MKQSTRWIAISAAAIVLLILLVNILLGRQLRQGHITTIEQEQAAQRSHFRLSVIHHLILSGTMWVNIMPADSNAIQVPLEQAGQGAKIPITLVFDVDNARYPLFHQLGDTLYVQGNNVQPLHRPFADWIYRRAVPQINVYASDLQSIEVAKGQIVVKGRPGPVTGTSLRLVAKNSTVWLGEMDTQPQSSTSRRKFPDEFFDTVSLRLTNSILLLNRPATIADLQARLDSSSELNDRKAKLGRSRISADNDSRASVTGGNLSKTTFTTE